MRFLEDSARFYFERMERQTGRRFLIMHDPLALAVALDPTLVETRRAAVDVETAGRLTTGATVVDWENRWGRLANTEVAVTRRRRAVPRRSSSRRWSGWRSRANDKGSRGEARL